jgi:hypothetical protein
MSMTKHAAKLNAPLEPAAIGGRAARQGRNVAAAAVSLVLGLALALLGAAGPADAQSIGGALGEAADALNLRTAPPPAADFVQRARPDDLSYQRIAPTDKANHRKSATELDALASSLENARAANLRAASRVRAPDQPAERKTAKAKVEAQAR